MSGYSPNRLLSRSDVEKEYGISRRYLEVSAVRGDGPPMIRVGARMVRYRIRDLDDWIDASRVVSTSDRG
jgi:predicted DNA-binding transcriptional regulator AlpA